MPAPTRPAQVANLLRERELDPDATLRALAGRTGLSPQSVANLERMFEPVIPPFRQSKRDLFTSVYQYSALENLEALEVHKQAGNLTAGDRRNYLTASAIAFDKSQLAAGQPTQIVAGIHEVRVNLPALLERLALVQGKIIEGVRKDGNEDAELG